jgi:hypothetical protein
MPGKFFTIYLYIWEKDDCKNKNNSHFKLSSETPRLPAILLPKASYKAGNVVTSLKPTSLPNTLLGHGYEQGTTSIRQHRYGKRKYKRLFNFPQNMELIAENK